MGVALENARLFDETQRLFKESEQRAAELAIINSVQRALAAELSIQGIYDAVGDKHPRDLQRRGRGHPDLRPHTGLSTSPTRTTRSGATTSRRVALGEAGFGAHVIRTRQTLVIDEDVPARSGSSAPAVASDTESCRRRRSSCRSRSADRCAASCSSTTWSASTPSASLDVRLLETLANSMSVALENARLFDETQRRARETAALAEVGREIGSSLDLSTVMERIAHHAKELLHAREQRDLPAGARVANFRAIVAIGESADAIRDTEIEPGTGIIGHLVGAARRSSSTTRRRTRAESRYPALRRSTKSASWSPRSLAGASSRA